VVFGPAPEGRPATLDEWALSLIRDGVVQVVAGTQEEFVPQMANYELVGGVSFKKGCYPGQEIVARTQYRASSERAVRVHSAAPLAPGESVYSDAFGDQCSGTVANVAPSPGGLRALVVASRGDRQGDLRLGSARRRPSLQPLPLFLLEARRMRCGDAASRYSSPSMALAVAQIEVLRTDCACRYTSRKPRRLASAINASRSARRRPGAPRRPAPPCPRCARRA